MNTTLAGRLTTGLHAWRGLILCLLPLMSCATASEMGLAEDDDGMHGSIDYPFAGSQRRLGGANHKRDDKLVVRTSVGNTEYQLEVPSAADDMDIEIPIMPLGGSQATGTLTGDRPGGLGNPSSADRELTGALPQIDSKFPGETGVLDKAFGTGPDGGYRQSPSYVLGIAKVNQHYKRREYEYAMVELNNLLAFYPNSPKLHKMKGTVLVRMGSLELAERAWVRAQQLEPDDASLNNGLRQLQFRIAALRRPTGSQTPPAPASLGQQASEPTAAMPPPPQTTEIRQGPAATRPAQLPPPARMATVPQSGSRNTPRSQPPLLRQGQRPQLAQPPLQMRQGQQPRVSGLQSQQSVRPQPPQQRPPQAATRAPQTDTRRPVASPFR